MDLSLPSARGRRRCGTRPWTLAILGVLLIASSLIQACSDNNGTVGPTFACNEQKGGVKVLAECAAGPVPVTGDAIGGPDGTLFVQVTLGTIDRGNRGTVLVIVTNQNGIKLPGRSVFLTPSAGRLDATSGTTDQNGLFSTSLFIPCEVPPETTVTVTAVVDGVAREAESTVAPGSACPPLPPVVVPVV